MLAEIAMALTLASPAFAKNEPIPNRFSRDGGNLSPPLEWQGAPNGTLSYALIVEDTDAPQGPFRHWAIYNIPSTARALAAGVGSHKPDTPIRMAVNDFGNVRYDGPQPPAGHGTHHYHFRLFALDVPQLRIPVNGRAQDVLEAARAHSLAEADVIGTFER